MPEDVSHKVLATQPQFQALYAIAGKRSQFKQLPKPAPPPTPEELKRAHDIKTRTLTDYPCKIPEPLHNSSGWEDQRKNRTKSTSSA